MSKRETIAGNVITVLDNVTSPIEFKKITREPFDPEELSNAQFPAMFISTGDETREDHTLGASGTGLRNGTIDFVIIGFVKGTETNIDTKRNQIIEVIEETLDADRTRGGNALETKIVEVSSDEGTLYPLGGVRIVVRVLYEFTRGTA
jgi:hypothetical protein